MRSTQRAEQIQAERSLDILVVAATLHELAFPNGWRTLCCGVGPVDSAANTAASIAAQKPDAIVHVGIAGARRHRALAPGSLVIGSASRYCDLTVSATWAPNLIATDARTLSTIADALPTAPQLVIGTSAQVGGTTECDVEAMEGFGVLRAAQLAGIPAVEVRAISNDIEESDRARWHFALGFDAIVAITPTLVTAMRQRLRP